MVNISIARVENSHSLGWLLASTDVRITQRELKSKPKHLLSVIGNTSLIFLCASAEITLESDDENRTASSSVMKVFGRREESFLLTLGYGKRKLSGDQPRGCCERIEAPSSSMEGLQASCFSDSVAQRGRSSVSQNIQMLLKFAVVW